MNSLRVFISHSSEDKGFCDALKTDLETCGVDVWLHEDSHQLGDLRDILRNQIKSRDKFIVVLSPAAFDSEFVEFECEVALTVHNPDSILPVTAAAYQPESFYPRPIWVDMSRLRRIEAKGNQPFPQIEAIKQILAFLGFSVGELASRAHNHNNRNEWKQAAKVSELVVKLAPDDFSGWANLAWARNELAHDDISQADKALEASEKAIALNPKDADVWNGKAWALNIRGKYAEALAAAEQALILNPGRSYIWNTKGRALVGLKHYEAALIALDRAHNLNPHFVPTLLHQATAYRALGQEEKAREAEKEAERETQKRRG
jgi:tetratricopeptide (TPR) repeat protein